MLNKWQLLWHDLGYRHLAMALVCSLLLHLLLLGDLPINPPILNLSSPVLEASLVLPKATVKPPKAKPLVKTTPVHSHSAASRTLLMSESPTILPTVDNQELSTAAPLIEPTMQQAMDIPITMAEPEDPVALGLIVNTRPYQHVESLFDLYTAKDSTIHDSPAGNAKITYQILLGAEQYRIESLMQAKGLAALFVPDLLQTSDGYLDNLGLQPEHYVYQFGKNKTYTADFDWGAKKIKLQSQSGQQTMDLAAGSQDLLSFMYQFMHVAPMQNMQLSITNGRKIGLYIYSFDGEETISSKIGNLKTLHITRAADEGEKKTDLWLSLDYQYLPVKIRETEKNGKVYELLIKSLRIENVSISPQSPDKTKP